MYPEFEKLIRETAAQDKKGLWNRWLGLHEILNTEQIKHLLSSVDSLYFGYALIMLLAPNRRVIARCTNWKSIKTDRGGFWPIDLDRVEWKDCELEAMRVAEKIVVAIMHDLAPRTELNASELRTWEMCESLIEIALAHQKVTDAHAQELLQRMRFHCASMPRDIYDSTPFYNLVSSAEYHYLDKRWFGIIWEYMERLIDRDTFGEFPRLGSCIPLGVQYAHVLYVYGKNQVPFNGFEKRVQFAVARGLFAKHLDAEMILEIVAHVKDSQILYGVAMNFVARQPDEHELECEYELVQIQRMCSAVKKHGTDEELKQWLQVQTAARNQMRRLRAEERKSEREQEPLRQLLEEMKQKG